MTKKFKTNARVQLTYSVSGPARGAVGTVLGPKKGAKVGSNFVLVAFDDFSEGHDGHCNYGGEIHNRYFVDVDFLEVVPKPKKPKATNTKIAKVRAHFISGRSLTQLEAIGLYGAFRLAARVHELKAEGMKIVTRMKEDPNGNPYAEYQLRSPWVKG